MLLISYVNVRNNTTIVYTSLITIIICIISSLYTLFD